MGEDEAADHRRSRTAVVVVEGVGDKPTAVGSQTVYRQLLRWGGETWKPGGQSDEWFRGHDEFGVAAEDPQPVTRYTLNTHDGRSSVDIYEFYWADLSRFASATRSFVVAAYSLFLEVAALGHAALRTQTKPLGPLSLTGDDAPTGRFARAGAILAFLEWLLAVPILFVSVLLLLLLGAGLIALNVSTHGETWTYIVLVAYGSGVGFAAWRWASARYSRERLGAGPLALILVVLSAAMVVWRIVAGHGDSAVGIADAVLYMAAYLFRGLWIAFSLLAIVFLVTLLLGLISGPNGRLTRQQAGTACLSLVGAFGVALFTAILYASLGVIFSTVSHTAFHQQPLCLTNLTDWIPGTCPSSIISKGQIYADDWGGYLLGECLAPLVLIVLVVLAAAVLAICTSAVPALVRKQPTRNVFPGLVKTAASYLIVAVIPSVLIAAVTWVPGALNLPETLATAVHQNLESPGRLSIPTIAAALAGFAVPVALGAARLLNLGVSGLGTAPVNPGVRSGMDMAADVLNFLREPSRFRGSNSKTRFQQAVVPKQEAVPKQKAVPKLEIMPRQRILARFAALIAYIQGGGLDGGGYDSVVFFAHSQGTVLTTSLLSLSETVIALPERCDLITFGCPLRNLLLWRLPSQFSWVLQLSDASLLPSGHANAFVRRVNGTWVNVGSDGDIVGRSLFGDPLPTPTTPETVMSSGKSPLFVWSDLSMGPGDHGSYWNDPKGITFGQLLALIKPEPSALSSSAP